MPIITPDTSEQVDLSPIPPSTCKAKITSAVPGSSKADKPKLVVKFDVYVPGNDKPRPRTAHLPTTGEGTFGFDQLLRAVHLNNIADRMKAGEKIPFDTDTLVGQELNVVIGEQIYEGQKRDQINGYLPA